MEKCVYCEGEHSHMTPEQISEIEREVLSDHIPDMDEMVHAMVRLIAEVRSLAPKESLIEALLEYNRSLKKAKDDCCITTASKEGLMNIFKLIGLDARKT